jgi:hypothetical protein
MESKAQVEKRFQGTIINSITYLPIEGVFLKSKNNESNAITNNEGYFSILLINNSSNNDSIIINALGYKSIKIPISILNKEPIKLYEDILTLPEVIIKSLFNWDNFAKKIKLEESTTPFESDFQKNITIIHNAKKTSEYKFKGYAHDEGFTLKGLRSNLRGKSFWYSVFFKKYTDTTSFINFNGYERPQLFSEFERGLFYWLLLLPNNKFRIADCKIIDVTVFGGDSIYIIKYEPKIEESKKLIDKVDRHINGHKIGNIYYSSLDKIFYIRKKDFTIIQIDFKQRNEISNTDTSVNIKNIIETSGSVKFQYFNDIPHPIFLNEKHIYEDKNGNIIERIDNIYYSNIKMIKLNEAELKKKYQINHIYRNYPIRDVGMLNYEKIGPFYYTPTIK